MPKSKYIMLMLALCLWALAAMTGCGADNRVTIDGVTYDKDALFLDLRGTGITVEHYQQLSSELPDCEIVWDIPFQGGYVDSSSTELTISVLTDDDVKLLGFAPDLTTINAEDCTDYPQLFALMEAHPDCTVTYSVTVGEESFPGDTTQLELTSPDHAALAEAMAYLPELTAVHISEPAASADQLTALQAQYPDAALTWSVSLCGEEYTMDVTEIDLSGREIASFDELEQKVACLPSLEKLIMNDCGFDNETMAQLRERLCESCKVVWTVQCGPVSVRTDETTFMPGKHGVLPVQYSNAAAYNLRYCEDMICIDIGHMPVNDVEWVKFMPHLKYLIIAHTSVSDLSPLSGCKELIYLEADTSPIYDYTPLLGCTALEDLNIGLTWGSADTIAQMTWLKNLWWIGLDGQRAQQLREALPDTNICNKGNRTVDGGWRQLQNYYDLRDMLGMGYLT